MSPQSGIGHEIPLMSKAWSWILEIVKVIVVNIIGVCQSIKRLFLYGTHVTTKWLGIWTQVVHYREVKSEIIAYKNRVDWHTGVTCTF